MSSSKSLWIAGGAAAVAGVLGAIYFFSKEGDAKVIKFDKSIHNLAYLLDVLEELKIEYASLYLHWFNMLVKMRKEKGEVPPQVLAQIKQKLGDLSDEIDKEVAEKYNISPEFIASLLSNHENDRDVKEYKKIIQLNYNRLFKFELPDFKFDYPKDFTKEQYGMFLKLSYEKFRFDVYNLLEKECRGRKATDEELKEAINGANLSKIKEDVYIQLGFPKLDAKVSRTIMKSYLNHIPD
jgi:hypothetical protein